MYYDEFFPFYAAYADPLLYERENIQEKEFALMNPGIRKLPAGYRKG